MNYMSIILNNLNNSDIKYKYTGYDIVINTTNKEADFVVKINGIKQKEIPELNDEFVKSLGEKEIQNVESLSKRIRINLEEKSKDELKKTLEEKTIDALIEKSKFVISPIIIENETEYIVDNQRKSLEAYKLDFDQYLKFDNY